MKYDDVSWHIHEIDEGLREDLREELSGAHMGLLLRWCFVNGFEVSAEDDDDDIIDAKERAILAEVKDGRQPGISYLRHVSDNKFVSDIVSSKIRPFFDAYYGGEEQQFLTDYGTLFDRQCYCSRESEIDFGRFSEMVHSRLREFQKMKNSTEKFSSLG
jgi:hypothetical protein